MHLRSSLALAAFSLLAPLASRAQAHTPVQPPPEPAAIQITADLSDAPRHLYHAEIELPVKPGPLTLTSPKWIPGTHRPTPIVESITGLVFTANGQTLAWRRDDVDMFEYHLTVPKGVTSIHAHLDLLNPGRQTDKLAALEWEGLLLYPAHVPVNDISIRPTVVVPSGWGVGTALIPVAPKVPVINSATHLSADAHPFDVTTVEQLEDSPVLTGQYFKQYALAMDTLPRHYLDVAADEDGDQNIRPALLAELTNLVHETGAMYGSRHYNVYHLLLTLTDNTTGQGLEHGQSSDNGVGEKGFADDAHQLANADLLAHEFTHSWNGKYRRPAGLYQPDFATPQQGEGLWVYEGMTQYLGNVLAARAGIKNQAQYRDILAASAANLDYKPGREWRSTDDTAVASSILRGGTPNWANWKRGQDYYQEGELLWLDIDTLIRSKTNNAKSLNDFEKIFLGKGGNTGPLIVPYTREELIADLNQVLPYDWTAFLHAHIDEINEHADLAGITQGGWQLTYADKPSPSAKITASTRAATVDTWYSLGLRLGTDSILTDVRFHSIADTARLSPLEKIIAVNGRTFSGERLLEAIRKAKDTTEPIHLIVESQSYIRTVDLNYHDGERYPVLTRTDGTPDYLDDITKPLTPPTPVPAAQ